MARDDQTEAGLEQQTIGFIRQDDITPDHEFRIDGGGRTVTVQVEADKEQTNDNIRRATRVDGIVVRNDIEYLVGTASAVDFREVTFESIQPQTLTFHVPIGCTAFVRTSGGKPKRVLVTQLGL